MRRRATGILCGLWCIGLSGAPPAGGYRFLNFDGVITTARDALRWKASDFPLRFRILENDHLPAGLGLSNSEWQAIVERALARWTEIPEARIDAVLEAEPVHLDRASADDGVNTIGFSGDERFADRWWTAYAAFRWDGEEPVGCDIEVSPYFVKNWSPQDERRLLEIIVTHEFGHCFGLAHSEPHPMPMWTDLAVHRDPAFLPDPVMSYTNSYGLELTDDDTIGVALLYPATGFFETRGSVSGAVTVEGQPAAHAYVQAVQPGAGGTGADPGPGTFADDQGVFLLEGLLPGDWMLWVHPILVVRRNAHGPLLAVAAEADALAFSDQLRWVRVEAGRVTEGVSITVRRGRGEAVR